MSKTPFLTVLTRTQGRRPVTLCDVMVALAAQSCDEFEWLIVGHRLDDAGRAMVLEMLEAAPFALRQRARLIEVERGNRTAPLNEGFAAALGSYVAILDDDDIPMGHWVETFRDLALEAPGQVLRAVAVKQQFDEVTVSGSAHMAPRAVSGFVTEYPSRFDWLEHLRMNQTPPVALAFPLAAFIDLGIRFDETLSTTEDWDYLVRTGAACGVASSPAVTCIYRWWMGSESSRSVHPQKEWEDNHQRILDKQDTLWLTLQPGTTKQLREMLDRQDRLSAKVAELAAELTALGRSVDLDGLQREDAGPRAELSALLRSASWRISVPMRWAKRVMRGLPPQRLDVGLMSPSQISEAIRNIRASSSWRVTAPLRKVRDRLRR